MRILNRSAAAMLLLCGLATVFADSLVMDTLKVYDNLNPGQFTQRGELLLNDPVQYNPVAIQNAPIPDTDANSKTSDPSMYTVLLRSQNTDSQFALSLPRCRLNGEQAPKETFVVHLSQDGSLLHVDYSAGKSENCDKSQTPVDSPAFSTSVVVKRRVQGPAPELAMAASIDMNTGKEKEPEPQKSFLAKYWYYIVPIVLMLMLSGEEPQKEGNTRR
ncbi:hypothetical protein H4R99_007085 [Coemansia sp. RSA 1722]|nr:hypothetical protein H4R99_007085 [Coemansia sp. RSA 1722]